MYHHNMIIQKYIQSFHFLFSSRRVSSIRLAIVFLMLLGWAYVYMDLRKAWTCEKPNPHNMNKPESIVQPVRPGGLKITAVVFYGRRAPSSLLECYLRRNLVSNGGWLDEVIWAINTMDLRDQEYMYDLVLTSDSYRRLDINEGGYNDIWQTAFTQNDTMYIKIDDDVIYIDDSAISRIVETKLQRPDSLIVSANIINSPALGWLHYHVGAVQAYLPELNPPDPGALSTRENRLWRSSSLPTWEGPQNWKSPNVTVFNAIFNNPQKLGGNASSPIPKHRWLPLLNPLDISRTPISQSEYHAWGNNFKSWAICAQEHYSFLESLEAGRLDRYFMVHGFDSTANSIWDMTGTRVSINFLAIWGEDAIKYMTLIETGLSDETQLALHLPAILDRRKFCFSILCLC